MNEHCRLWDKDSHCEFVIQNLFGRCACNSYFKQSGTKCLPLKLSSYATEPVIAEQDTLHDTSSDSSNNYEAASLKDPSGQASLVVASDDVKPSKLPMFTSKNDVLSTQEDSPLMQAVMKVPFVEQTKRLPVSNRKDGESNELIKTDEITANLHANDQPVYRVVTHPSIDKKSNKKNVSSKEQNGKQKGHQKKSSLKGKFI